MSDSAKIGLIGCEGDMLPMAVADRWRMARGAFANALVARHGGGGSKGFLAGGERGRSTVAEGGLLPMPGQRLLFMGQIREVNRVKRRKMKCRI